MSYWMRLLSVALLATMLAACGSDSEDDDSDNPPVEEPEPEPEPEPEEEAPDSVSLSLLGRFSTGQFDESAAEITAYHVASERAFVVNALAGVVDVLDLSDPANPEKLDSIATDDIAEGSVVNSVAVHGDLIALAVEAPIKTDPGYAALYAAEDLSLITQVPVGALPDMVAFTPDGQYLLVANEGEPSDDYSIDPEGSISILALSELDNVTLRTADFTAFNDREDELREEGVRIFGPGASVAQDLEPEYIAVSADSRFAFVSLQENNALARIDIEAATVTDVLPLGYEKQWGESYFYGSGSGLDVSDEDGAINISTQWSWLYGMFMPDAIAAYESGGQTYIISANEGDARAWGEDNQDYWDGDTSQGFVEEIRVKHLVHPDGFARRVGDDMPAHLAAMADGALLSPVAFGYCGASEDGDPGNCRDDDQLGRLNVTWTKGYMIDDEGNPVMYTAQGERNPEGRWLMYSRLYAFGTRGFSIWNAEGERVWDSGDRFEQYLASDDCMAGTERDIPCKDYFNSNHDDGDDFDSRSDAKGPEPEGVTVGQIGDKVFAFVGLERMGGIMVYDVTDPTAPVFNDYFNTRDNWMDDPEEVLDTLGDLGPEGLTFVPAAQSPNGQALLIVGNEVSGTTAIYQVDQRILE